MSDESSASAILEDFPDIEYMPAKCSEGTTYNMYMYVITTFTRHGASSAKYTMLVFKYMYMYNMYMFFNCS